MLRVCTCFRARRCGEAHGVPVLASVVGAGGGPQGLGAVGQQPGRHSIGGTLVEILPMQRCGIALPLMKDG